LSLDDADTLTCYQNKLKQAPNDLLKPQMKKKQDKSPTLYTTMEMPEYLQDKILVRGARRRWALD